MSAREEWKQGKPRPVVFGADFRERDDAIAFVETLGGYDAERAVESYECECCGKTYWQAIVGAEGPRDDLPRAYASWAHDVKRAGGQARDEVIVLFDEPDQAVLTPGTRPLRRHGGRRHRRRRTR